MATAEELNKNGMGLYREGKFAEAAAAYEEAVTLKPDYAPCFVNLTLAYIKLEKHDEAIRAAQRATAIAPQAGMAHHYLGNAFNAKGRWNEAVSAYARAFEVDQGQVASLVPAAHLCLDNGVSQKSVEFCRQFLAAAPADHPKRAEMEQLQREAEGGSGLISKF